MQETLTSDSIEKRLRLQNEVLKWLSEFSEKLLQRAKDTEMEMNGLFDQAGAVELDLKNTVNTLCNLSRDLLINHKISDEDDIACHPLKDHAESSAQAGIPAQDYQKDILPRYKNALSLGLNSCRKHLHGIERRHMTSSVSRTGLVYRPLPHIIGSEEFIHDNSCGITENTSLGNPQLDLGLILESKQASSVAEELDSLDLFGPDIFGNQQDSSEKDMTDPVASAASDFKAMLEAALLNQYKFHDEESLSVKDILRDKMISGQIHTDVLIQVGTSGERQVSQGTSEQLNSTIEEDKPVTEGNLCSVTHPQELYSALLGGSLFDNDEDLLSSGRKESTDVSTYVGESNSWWTGIKGKDNSMCSNEEESGQRAPWQVVNSDE
ncbi:uncharacterized protein LOC103991038 isoform X1 [Musa acuminata AAA Group]|uniref:uncharacterized protein LOC103991038 isoform X1 n=1 Tax=Musa acuminata AAA Group TaxID=214697 RepID=UPI0031E0B71C